MPPSVDRCEFLALLSLATDGVRGERADAGDCVQADAPFVSARMRFDACIAHVEGRAELFPVSASPAAVP